MPLLKLSSGFNATLFKAFVTGLFIFALTPNIHAQDTLPQAVGFTVQKNTAPAIILSMREVQASGRPSYQIIIYLLTSEKDSTSGMWFEQFKYAYTRMFRRSQLELLFEAKTEDQGKAYRISTGTGPVRHISEANYIFDEALKILRDLSKINRYKEIAVEAPQF